MSAATDTSRAEAVEARQPHRASRWHRMWRKRWIYIFLLPTAVLYGMYTVWPVLGSYWYSLVEWTGFESTKTFVGLDNFVEVFGDRLFWNSLKVTALFMVVTVPLRVGLALAAALALNHPRLPFVRLFRTALFLPVVTTTAIIGVVMQFVFDPAGGPINLVLIKLGVIDQGINFLGDSNTALWTIMAVHTWKWLGITMIYWLAALQVIPRELHEAARVDGASGWQSFRRVTLPLLMPFLVIITLLTIEQNIRIFDLMMTMTGGGPFYSTEVIELYIYRWAFGSTVPHLGYASAAAVIFGLLMLTVGAVQALGLRQARKQVRENS